MSSSAKEFDTMCERINSAEKILLLSHVNPDGDALGSMAALAWAARQAGKTADILLHDELKGPYAHLCSGLDTYLADQFDSLSAAAELIIILDTASVAQLGNLAPKLAPLREKIIVIDHHLTTDDIASACWFDTSAAAVGVMVIDILEKLGWKLDTAMATYLSWAIVTDTGWLRFSNTDGRCLRAMAKLVDLGTEPDMLYRQIYQNDRPEKVRLLSRALDSLKLMVENKLAIMTLTLEDFAIAGAAQEETEGIVNEPMRIGSLEMSVIFVETQNSIRVSLRSREKIDVAAIAKHFGGGGHARAAGVKFETRDMKAVQNEVIKKILESF